MRKWWLAPVALFALACGGSGGTVSTSDALLTVVVEPNLATSVDLHSAPGDTTEIPSRTRLVRDLQPGQLYPAIKIKAERQTLILTVRDGTNVVTTLLYTPVVGSNRIVIDQPGTTPRILIN